MESSRRFSLLLIPILALSLFLFRACKSENSSKEQAELLQKADSLQANVESAWTAVLQADDQMQYNLNSLVQVLAAEEVIDSVQFDSLERAVQALGPARRQMETMDSDAIDAYDEQWYALSAHVVTLPGEDASPAAINLILGIDDFAQTQVLSVRTEYDQAARDYNAWYREHGNKVDSDELPSRYPLFSLQE